MRAYWRPFKCWNECAGSPEAPSSTLFANVVKCDKLINLKPQHAQTFRGAKSGTTTVPPALAMKVEGRTDPIIGLCSTLTLLAVGGSPRRLALRNWKPPGLFLRHKTMRDILPFEQTSGRGIHHVRCHEMTCYTLVRSMRMMDICRLAPCSSLFRATWTIW